MQPQFWHRWYPRESPPHTEPRLSAIDLVALGMAFPLGGSVCLAAKMGDTECLLRWFCGINLQRTRHVLSRQWMPGMSVPILPRSGALLPRM